ARISHPTRAGSPDRRPDRPIEESAMGRPARAADLKIKQEVLIPARTGAGLRVEAGEFVQVLDVAGQQCADFFAFRADDPREYLSASHTRVQVDRLFPL